MGESGEEEEGGEQQQDQPQEEQQPAPAPDAEAQGGAPEVAEPADEDRELEGCDFEDGTAYDRDALGEKLSRYHTSLDALDAVLSGSLATSLGVAEADGAASDTASDVVAARPAISPLRREILRVARDQWATWDAAGSRAEKVQFIRNLFTEGPGWTYAYWRDVLKNHTNGKIPDWCAAFVLRAYRLASRSTTGGEPPTVDGKEGLDLYYLANVKYLRPAFGSLLRAHDPAHPVTPGRGDVLFTRTHVALVYFVEPDGTINLIEGNGPGGVALMYREVKLSSRAIVGFGRAEEADDPSPSEWLRP
jgi:hypothetical protein